MQPVSCDAIQCFRRSWEADQSAQFHVYVTASDTLRKAYFINPFVVNTMDPKCQTRSLRLGEVTECALRQERELSGTAGGGRPTDPGTLEPCRDPHGAGGGRGMWAPCLQGSGRPLLSPAAGRRKGWVERGAQTRAVTADGEGLPGTGGEGLPGTGRSHCPLRSVSRTGTLSTDVQNRVSRERARRGLSS